MEQGGFISNFKSCFDMFHRHFKAPWISWMRVHLRRRWKNIKQPFFDSWSNMWRLYLSCISMFLVDIVFWNACSRISQLTNCDYPIRSRSNISLSISNPWPCLASLAPSSHPSNLHNLPIIYRAPFAVVTVSVSLQFALSLTGLWPPHSSTYAATSLPKRYSPLVAR